MWMCVHVRMHGYLCELHIRPTNIHMVIRTRVYCNHCVLFDLLIEVHYIYYSIITNQDS